MKKIFNQRLYRKGGKRGMITHSSNRCRVKQTLRATVAK